MASLLKSRSVLLKAVSVGLGLFLLHLATRPLDWRTRVILNGATKVEVFRIDGGDAGRDARVFTPGDGVMDGYRITAQGTDQGPEFAARLAGMLTDRWGYSLTGVKCYNPGVAFRVYKGEERVDVVICFKCSNLYVGPPSDRPARENKSFDGTSAGPRLLQLAKEAFPDDKDIQDLKLD
jgi:hypothetical protein